MSTQAPVPLETLLAHRPFVAALARALVRDPGAADDLAQEAWVAAIERPPAPGGSVRGWFARVMRNARRDAWRSAARRARREAEAPPPEAPPTPDEIVARAEIHRRVVLAVFALDEPSRATVILRFFEGLDATEIAARTGVPPATVRKRLERALDQLRERLDAEDDGNRGAWMALLAPLAAAGDGGGAVGAGAGSTAGSPGVPDGAPAGTSPGAGGPSAPVRRWGRGTSVAAAAVLVAGLGAAFWALTPDDGDGAGPRRRDAAAAGGPGVDVAGGPGGAASGTARRRRTDAPPTPQSPTGAPADTAAAPAPPVAPEPAADVIVTVLTPTGDPAVGATVTLLRMLRDPAFVSYTSGVPDPPAMPVASRAVTGVDGRATLTGLVQANHVLTAEAAGLAGAQPVWMRPGKAPQSIRMLLRRAGVVTGRVTDAATGAPADAEVVAMAMQDLGAACDAARRRARTAADGTFRIDAVPQGTVVVSARRPGGFFAGGTLVALDIAARADLRLAPVADVAGTAVDDATSEPVEGAPLDAIVTANSGVVNSPAHASLVTGPGGRFELRAVPVGSTVQVGCADDGPWKTVWPTAATRWSSTSTGRAGSDGCTALVVRMLRPAAIEGVVTAADGSPAAGAEVVVIGDHRSGGSISAGAVLATVRADASGRYRAGGLAPGRVEVFARCGNGHSELPMSGERRMALLRLGAEGDPRIEVAAGAVARADLRLVAGLEIRGRVVRADGTAAAGAWAFVANRSAGNDFAATADADRDGRFVLRAVPVAGPPLVVGASLAGAGGGRTEVPDPAVEVTIRLDAPGATDVALSGRVVGPDGAAVPSARLFLIETPRDDDGLPARFERYVDRSDARLLPLRDDGTFAVDGISGRYRDRFLLVATARGFLQGSTMVPVRPGARIGDIRVTLRAGAEIRGVLRDAAGAPVAGMPVRAVRAPRGSVSYDGVPPTEETGADGAFRVVVEPEASVCLCFGAIGEEVLALPSVPPGRDVVEVRLPADARPRSIVDAEALAREQRSPRPARGASLGDEIPTNWVRVEGRVLGADGKGVEGVHVTHVVTDGPGRASRGTSTVAGGRFSIPVPAGAVGTILVDGRERGVAAREGVAAGAGPVEIRVAPRAEPIVCGVVRDADRAPVAGVVVTCVQWLAKGRKLSESIDVNDEGWFDVNRADLRIVRTDADGAYSVASLPIGRWTVYAGRPGTPWTPADVGEIDVTDGAQDASDRDLRVEPGHVLRVRLLDADGQARRGARVFVTGAKSAAASPVEFRVEAAADGDGVVELTGLPAGPWHVSLNGGGGAAPAEVPESAAPADLRL